MKIKTFLIVMIGFSLPAITYCQDSSGNIKTETKLHKFFHPGGETNTAKTDSTKPKEVIPPVENKITTANTAAIKNNIDSNSNQKALVTPVPVVPASAIPVTNTIYRDTRLGSSSPLYDTYEKNKDGAGSVTTNPNKG